MRTTPTAASPGGSAGEVQVYDLSGNFGGATGFSWASTTRTISHTTATLTAAAAGWSHSSTWNGAGVEFPGVVQDVTDTASASTSTLHQWRVGGTRKVSLAKDGGVWGWAAYTNSTNYERGGFRFEGGGYFVVGNEAAGTGGAWPMVLRSANGEINFGNAANSSAVVGVFSGGNQNVALMLKTSTTAYGGSGTIRGYLGRINAAVGIFNGSGTPLLASPDGTTRLCLGGTTSSYPAIKPSGADLQVRLGDDSGYAIIYAKLPTSNPGPGVLWNNAGTPAIGT